MSRLGWAWHRLVSMPVAEVPHRAAEQLRRVADRWATAPRLAPGIASVPPPAWPVDRASIAAAVPPEWLDRLGAEVDDLLAGRVRLLGVDHGSRTGWGADPSGGAPWAPDRSPWAIPADRDVKLAWEPMRLQHLQVLALGAALLARDDARQACLDDLASWFAYETPYRGVAWGAGIECAARVASLVVIARLLEPIPQGLWAPWWASLAAQAAWLDRYPSLYSSANNHRVAELGALLAVAVLAPDLPLAHGAPGYAEQLQALAAVQLHADGVGAEQSPTYQAFTMEWLLVARVLCEHGSVPFDVDDRLRSGATFLRALMDASGRVPRIGDDDAGVVLRPAMDEPNLPASICGAVAGVLAAPEVAPPGWQGDPRTALLGGLPVAGSATVGSATFAEGGYTVLRWQAPAGQAVLVFDHGPLGFAWTAGHGHADALSVWLTVGEQPLLVDSGTYRYNGAPDWRRWMRGTYAHNTVVVDGVDQSQQTGPFNWGRRAVARLVDLDLVSRRAAALHDGFLSGSGVVHLRTVAVPEPDLVEIEDLITGTGTHDIEVIWHFAPGLALEPDGAGRWRVVRGQAPVALFEALDDRLVARVALQDEVPGPGVVSEGYNLLSAAPCLVLSARVALPARLPARFRLAAR